MTSLCPNNRNVTVYSVTSHHHDVGHHDMTVVRSAIKKCSLSEKMITGSVGLALIMWSACGIISLFGALCALELGLMFPASGGAYVYIHNGLGDMLRIDS